MPDDLERLEKDWPQHRSKRPSPRMFTRMYLAGAIVMAATANLLTAIAVYHWNSSPAHDPFWWMTPSTFVVALNMPWLEALISHRLMKKLAASTGANAELMRQIRHQGIRQMFVTYASVSLIVISFFLLLLQVQFGTFTR